ncbi:MAG: hypothetical protein ACTSQI_05000 [Candidatus Helarchaeota archaeon]
MVSMEVTIAIARVIAPILAGIFAFRAVFKFIEWHDGDQDQLWNFLSLCCGAVSSIFFFLGINGLYTGPLSIVEIGFYTGFILTVAAVALMFVATFLKWRKVK